MKERQETVSARHIRQNELLNEYVEGFPTDGPQTLADPMVEQDSAEDKGNALRGKRGQRLITTAQQAAE